MASFLISKTKTSTIFLIALYCYCLTFIKKSGVVYCYPFTLTKDLFICYLHNINLLTISKKQRYFKSLTLSRCRNTTISDVDYCYHFIFIKDLFICYLHNINLLTVSISTYCINYAMSYNYARSLEGYFPLIVTFLSYLQDILQLSMCEK